MGHRRLFNYNCVWLIDQRLWDGSSRSVASWFELVSKKHVHVTSADALPPVYFKEKTTFRKLTFDNEISLTRRILKSESTQTLKVLGVD